ncbi:MAG: HmuY family protein [Butyricimonas faecihominis]
MDVAFNRYYVKTNSGTSGKGKGGVLDSERNFAAVTGNVNSEFVVDDSLNIMTTMGNFTKILIIRDRM